MLVVRLKSVSDLQVFTKHELNKRAVKKYISPVVGPGSVDEKYTRIIKMDVERGSPDRVNGAKPRQGGVVGFFAGMFVSAALFAGYSLYKDGKIKLSIPSLK